MLALTACGGGDDSSADPPRPTSQEESAGAEQAAEPDLEGIPDVVAEVNGQEVTKDDFVLLYEAQFQQAAMQAAQTGGEQPDEDALKEQTADDLVDTELLTQEAESRGIDRHRGGRRRRARLDRRAEPAGLRRGAARRPGEAGHHRGPGPRPARVADDGRAARGRRGRPGRATEKELRAIYRQAKQQQAQMGQQGGQQQEIPPYAKVKPQLVEQAKADRVARSPGRWSTTSARTRTSRSTSEDGPTGTPGPGKLDAPAEPRGMGASPDAS